MWRQLWESAAAVPAAAQRPLFDPVLEGERALHFLETLPPALLFGDVLACGFSAAAALLGKAEAAALPAVAGQLERWVVACGLAGGQAQGGQAHGGSRGHSQGACSLDSKLWRRSGAAHAGAERARKAVTQ